MKIVCFIRIAVRNCALLAVAGVGLAGAAHVEVVVTNQVANRVDARLFGQFLERPSWTETGPEKLADENGELPKAVVERLRAMRIPVIRFPGGTDIDYMDWTDMIDHAPRRAPGEGRPTSRGHQGDDVTNRLGWHEYFRLRDQLGCETIVAVNFLDGLARRRPLAEAAEHAAALVAYLNTPLGGRAVTRDGVDWPGLRALNGHAAPFRVEYVQIGNEWFVGRFMREVRQATGLSGPELAAWYRECLFAYVAAIQRVDPTVRLIIDGKMDSDVVDALLSDPELRALSPLLALHTYSPGAADKIFDGQVQLEAASVTAFDWWQAAVVRPGEQGPEGMIAYGGAASRARAFGYRLACTEWNWNAWNFHNLAPEVAALWPEAAGVSAAAFLHGLMREGADIELATQSMLIGHSWNIMALRYDPKHPGVVTRLPQGMVTALYSRHHGPTRLKVETENVDTFRSRLGLGLFKQAAAVTPLVDVVATADATNVFVHIANRSFEEPVDFVVTLPEGWTKAAPGTAHLILPWGETRPTSPPEALMREETRSIEANAAGYRFTSPARSISVLVLPRDVARSVGPDDAGDVAGL